MENYQAVFKRKEIKYLLSSEERNALLPILEAHMEPDAFAHSSISNLYYDTPDFRMVRRSLEKPMYKEKLRLRSYGTPENTSTVFPEIKKKAMGIVYKRRISLPYQEAVSFLSGQQIASQIRATERRNRLLPLICATERRSRLLPLICATERHGKSSTSWAGCWLLMKTCLQGCS